MTGFTLGDTVVGFIPMGADGSAAEYVVAPADALTKAPTSSDLAGAAALPSVEMFLIHQLRREDILPAGDLGIRAAIQRVDGLAEVPTIDEARARGETWAPYRTYAAALLWRSLP